MDQIRVDQQNLPKKERYGIGELLKTIDLKRPTYYDERKRIINKNDKYADVKKKVNGEVLTHTAIAV